MARFKLAIEYDGTRFSGWQVQRNARTVQGEIRQCLGAVLKTESFDFQGAGRTDAGVHALRQVAHLEAQTTLPPDVLRIALNDGLPADITILSVTPAPPRFHARHDAVSRSYLYQISRRRTAFGKRFVWWVKDPLDVDRMRDTVPHFLGLKDYRAFTADDPEETSTQVHIEEMRLAESGALILLRIRGSHFLWKMVRRMIGVMAEVGRGTLPPSRIKSIFTGPADLPARLTAPPSGLFLENVLYKGDTIEPFLTPVLTISHER